ncbi:hypothetical protein PT974_01194 [Cladobotryum mycophilum]|uniref:F-box domain-containing protein n=1 Tax=Cladobotryum mycophilum TaxID=491253 RepID=A0ABR0T499_9HYPO
MARQPSDKYMISRLSRRPKEASYITIRISNLPKPSSVARVSTSATGILKTFPLEIMHNILENLDFLSLTRFSRTSRRANESVNTLKLYRDLMVYAAETLGALGRTRLISYHTAGEIFSVLKTDRCVSCGHYGSYLFLPTLERCCYNCLEYNQSLWVMSRMAAQKCFCLTSRQVDQLPNMLSIAGKSSRRRRLKLVSVRAVKELAIKVHGSEQDITSKLYTSISRPLSNRQISEYNFYLAAPLKPFTNDPMFQRDQGYYGILDPFFGMAATTFPSLSKAGLETGLWCRGCDYNLNSFGRSASAIPISNMIPRRLRACKFLSDMQLRARSRADFLEHIKHCFGVPGLSPAMATWQRSIQEAANQD